jgi:hypothetical protein
LVAQNKGNFQLPYIAIGSGVLSFKGDVGKSTRITNLSNTRAGLHLNLEERLGNFFGLSINAIYGKLASNDIDIKQKLNFESKIIQADINLIFYFDNNKMFKRCNGFSPYFGIGAGVLKFDSYSDLKSSDGKFYNYWSDGSIRSISETDADANSAIILQRDYKYETKLNGTTNNYPSLSASFPIQVGIKFNLTDKLNFNFGASYYLTLTDWLDNVKDGSNDKYLYSHFSIQYLLGKPYDNTNYNYGSIDFAALDNLDSDADGIRDGEDKCPGTPIGIKVDGSGCPLDSDDDGVPDYKDKEPKTQRGKIVDENGVTLTDKMIAAKQAERDSAATDRSRLFNQSPSLEYMLEVESKAFEKKNKTETAQNIPLKFRGADLNHDGIISAEEVTTAIRNFFEDETEYTVEKLNELIEFFFEQ